MLRIILYFIIVSVVFLNTNDASGQVGKIFKNNKTSYTTLGIGGGSSHFLGDLAPYSKAYMALYSNVRWNGVVNYQYHFNPKLSARVGFSYIRIFGNDENFGGALADNKMQVQRLRNLHFRNDMMEFSVMGIYTLFPLEERRHKNQKLRWSPYIGAGVAIVGHNPKARGSIQDKNDGYSFESPNANGQVPLKEWTSLKNEGNNLLPDGSIKTYSSITPAFPLVIGIKTKINNNWILAVEGGLRLTLTDFLDDVGDYKYNLSSNSKISYRADEDYSAYSGKSRVEVFRKASGNTTDGYTYPSALANGIVDPAGYRGTRHKDSYIVTQITLNYIIGDQVKCPPIK